MLLHYEWKQNQNQCHDKRSVKYYCSWTSWRTCFLPLFKKTYLIGLFLFITVFVIIQMNLGLTRVLAVGQNIWPHDLFKQCLLNFSGKWGDNICMLNVDPCFGSIYFQMLRRKRAKRPWSPWETRSADWLGVWVSCQIFNCQCRGDKIKISPGSERLLK